MDAVNTSQTGVPGLDEILNGTLPKDHLYLVQGKPGTGKTTLSMQFLLKGLELGEQVLYVTFSETKLELQEVAKSHGWDVSKLPILELSTYSASLSQNSQNTLFHPAEVELNKLINILFEEIKKVKPKRIVFDSVSELRLLADSSLRYRRQMLAFKEFFIDHGGTVLFLDDLSSDSGDMHVQSIVHGVILLEKFRAAYGIERRQIHIAKLRGVNFIGGTHDYIIEKGGIKVFPRLVSSHYKSNYRPETLSSGSEGLDALLGGGLDRGTSNLILGPAGTGKSTIALQFAVAGAAAGKKVAIYNFEEAIENVLVRSAALGLDLEKYIKNGNLTLRKVDPAELTPGQFASLVREAHADKVDIVVIDSLNGYIHAMPERQFLMLQLHELLSFLGKQGIVTLMVLSQSGVLGSNMASPLDLTYLADSVLLTRYFEVRGAVKKAISVVKKRTGAHEKTLRELKIGKGGVSVGPVLSNFSGIFSGMPEYLGQVMEQDDK